MKRLAFVWLMLMSAIVFGQQSTDVVVLKSGAMYKGTISEYIPDSSVTIKLTDGRVMTFEAEVVNKVSMHGQYTVQVKKKGYYNITSLGILSGLNFEDSPPGLAFNLENGYKFKNHNLGVGLGVENVIGQFFLPVYGSYSYSFFDEGFSPFLQADCGYSFSTGNDRGDGPYYFYSVPDNYNGGLMAGGSCGIRLYFSSGVGMVFSMGYRYYNLEGGPYEVYLNPENSYPLTQRAQLHRFIFKVGMLLN